MLEYFYAAVIDDFFSTITHSKKTIRQRYAHWLIIARRSIILWTVADLHHLRTLLMRNSSLSSQRFIRHRLLKCLLKHVGYTIQLKPLNLLSNRIQFYYNRSTCFIQVIDSYIITLERIQYKTFNKKDTSTGVAHNHQISNVCHLCNIIIGNK